MNLMHLCINELGEFGLSRLVINFLLHFGRVYLMYISSPSIQVRTNQPRWYEITEWYRYSGVQSGCNLVIPHGFVRYPDSNMNPLQKMGKIIWYIDRLDTGKVDLAESKNLVISYLKFSSLTDLFLLIFEPYLDLFL